MLTITAPGSRTVTYDYRYRDALALDGNGNPFEGLEATSVTGVDGNTSISSYDALHRLRYSTTSGADPTYYAYGVVDSGWFHRLEMRRASGGSTVPTTQWSFAMGTGYSTRPTRLRRTAGGTHEDATYAFNAAGELVSVTAPEAGRSLGSQRGSDGVLGRSGRRRHQPVGRRECRVRCGRTRQKTLGPHPSLRAIDPCGGN